MTAMDPIVLFFLLGLMAGLMRSDLRLPAAIYEFLTVVLLLAIGLKGGVELSGQSLGLLAPQMIAVVVMGLVSSLVLWTVVLRPLHRQVDADAFNPPDCFLQVALCIPDCNQRIAALVGDQVTHVAQQLRLVGGT